MTTHVDLLRGAVDLHIHTAPDIFPRCVTAVTAAQAAKQAGMRAIVVKSHSTDTAARAEMASDIAQFPVYGAVVLNYSVGGLNEYAVLETARQGGRIVWMPTISARHFIPRAQSAPMLMRAIPSGVPGLVISHDGVRIDPPVARILDLIAEHGLVLATGHLAPLESRMLVEEAVARGVRRIVVTHPHETFVGMSIDDVSHFAALGAFIEFTDNSPLEERVKTIRAVGVAQCFVSTDGGTTERPSPVVRLTSYLNALLEAGFSEAEVRHMSASVPAYLLGLDGRSGPPRLTGAG